ncbi:hypothetical protein [Rhodohalobacter sp. 614A]|uniref:hypothetical protein n=1 Tax=Rhodohalobacter sp. 614A TaxID=2908649 RepID=UPI001F271082|nr:hypothetical protein [Rhodohalobacter sp. 614A]
MNEEVFIVAIVFGSIVSIVFLGIIGSIIKAWVKKGSSKNLSENQEFLAALREFKEKTDRRLSNLEAIITDEKPPAREKSNKKELPEKEKKSAIEIEIETEKKKESSKESGKLRNMLNQ